MKGGQKEKNKMDRRDGKTASRNKFLVAASSLCVSVMVVLVFMCFCNGGVGVCW